MPMVGLCMSPNVAGRQWKQLVQTQPGKGVNPKWLETGACFLTLPSLHAVTH